MDRFPEGNAIVYCQGSFATTNGKTAHGLVRHTQRYHLLSVIDSRHSGKDAGAVLDGKLKGIPIYADIHEAFQKSSESGTPATHCVVGLAPDGGRLSSRGRDDIKKAIKLGLHIDCGLHDILSDDEELAQCAKEHNVRIRDIRKPPARDTLHFFCGKIAEVESLKIAVLGTDSAIGKRTTAWILLEAFERAGLSVELIGTGQTAWMQGVRYGLILDALIVDFVTGEIEHAVWQAWKKKKPDVILIEGQGSLLNPAYPGGMEILSAGRPDAVVLQHAPARKEYDGFPEYVLHPLAVQIKAIETVSESPVAAVTINHENLFIDDIDKICRQISIETGLPTVDVLNSGAGGLIPYLTTYNKRVNKKYHQSGVKHFPLSATNLQHFKTIDILEVGPVYIERDRFRAPYTVRKGGTINTFELIYRFEEDVFNPNDSDSINLAHMIAAQVAFNYGLFCNKIIYYGPYDDTDRSLIREMTENTAREIYVKRFFKSHQFLVSSFPPTPLILQSSYGNAEIVFPEDTYPGNEYKWEQKEESFCILLSGGKESLLSYAVLDELGFETHPVFINESGRHWYTALNSYRYFKKNVPNTMRVWTNSDRLFVWMLRHFPFIRSDFAGLRADDYPIRLWTVAVFLFGALPLLKKRRVGCLIIGDEYDTTRQIDHHGILHYDGLYDQSRYFDEALSTYFMRKKWNIQQFSIVRPLSEMIVLKILIERYAQLQKHQVSCHMAHINDEKALPCGKCEKCYRIVGMLSAVGGDPTMCGYTEQQVRQCVDRLPHKNLHQELVTSMHTLYLLSQKGLIDTQCEYKPFPEVEHLRFDDECSPLDAVPKNIRSAILRIQMEHAAGTLMKSGEDWLPFNPLDGSRHSRNMNIVKNR